MKPGEVYSYIPKSYWCHEGTAIVAQNGQLVDTYWGIDANPYEYAISCEEAHTATLLFDTADFDQLDKWRQSESKSRWEQFVPGDRQRVTSQHGLQVVYFLRNGAHRSLATRIANAQRDLEFAKDELQSAQYCVDLCTEELAELQRELEAIGKP